MLKSTYYYDHKSMKTGAHMRYCGYSYEDNFGTHFHAGNLSVDLCSRGTQIRSLIVGVFEILQWSVTDLHSFKIWFCIFQKRTWRKYRQFKSLSDLICIRSFKVYILKMVNFRISIKIWWISRDWSTCLGEKGLSLEAKRSSYVRVIIPLASELYKSGK
jgi:hypothetical protein